MYVYIERPSDDVADPNLTLILRTGSITLPPASRKQRICTKPVDAPTYLSLCLSSPIQVRIYIYIYVYIYMSLSIYGYIYIYICIHVCMYTCWQYLIG